MLKSLFGLDAFANGEHLGFNKRVTEKPPVRGDPLYIVRGGISGHPVIHMGVLVGDGQVVHVRKDGVHKGEIIQSTLVEFAASQPLSDVRILAARDSAFGSAYGEEVARNAESDIGKKIRYSIFGEHCQFFVSKWTCRPGEMVHGHSQQEASVGAAIAEGATAVTKGIFRMDRQNVFVKGWKSLWS